MVNFNDGDTVAKSATDLEQIMILEKRENFLIAREQYKTQTLKGMGADTAYVQSRLTTLFYQIEAMLKRKNKALWEELNLIARSDDEVSIGRIDEAFINLSHFLDDIKLTRIDNKSKLPTDIVQRNKITGNA